LQEGDLFQNRQAAGRLAVSGCILIAGHDMLFNDFKVFRNEGTLNGGTNETVCYEGPKKNYLGAMINEGRKE
jgi:hypothetical protein